MTLPLEATGTRMRRSAWGSDRRSAAYRMLIENRARPAMAVETCMPPTAASTTSCTSRTVRP
jgi:hypothetical protein